MEEIEEVWKECGVAKRCTYYVSNLGRVKSITCRSKRELILKNCPDSHGYPKVFIPKGINIYTLVAYNFLGPRPEGLYIDHIDRNILNSRLDNLRYVTPSENNKNSSTYRDDILEEDLTERNKILCKKNYEANREERLEKKKEKYTCE